MTRSLVPLAYFWGDDSYGLERAAARLGEQVAAGGEPLEVWRVRGEQTTPADIVERVGTSPMFSGGTLVIVSDPYSLVRAEEDRLAMLPVVGSVAPGNALAFIEAVDGNRAMASLKVLRDAVAEGGGEVRQIKAPQEAGMVGWIQQEATARRIRLATGAAQELAKRIGAFVREGDVDRRRQSHLAIGELEKLALYRMGETVTVADVAALVPEAVPGSIWAFLDAVGGRQVRDATELLDRLLRATPPPVLVAVLYRRVRDLIIAADLARAGATPPEKMKALNSKSEWAIGKLVTQSMAWTPDELERALEGLLELDATTKGRDERALTESQTRLTFLLWLTDHVRRSRPGEIGTPARRAGGGEARSRR
jgi:DNA polymerase III delta subunit